MALTSFTDTRAFLNTGSRLNLVLPQVTREVARRADPGALVFQPVVRTTRQKLSSPGRRTAIPRVAPKIFFERVRTITRVRGSLIATAAEERAYQAAGRPGGTPRAPQVWISSHRLSRVAVPSRPPTRPPAILISGIDSEPPTLSRAPLQREPGGGVQPGANGPDGLIRGRTPPLRGLLDWFRGGPVLIGTSGEFATEGERRVGSGGRFSILTLVVIAGAAAWVFFK